MNTPEPEKRKDHQKNPHFQRVFRDQAKEGNELLSRLRDLEISRSFCAMGWYATALPPCYTVSIDL